MVVPRVITVEKLLGEDMNRVPQYWVNVREFLNLPNHHAGAYILAQVEKTAEEESEYGFGCSIMLEIGDCSRRISLSLSVDSENEYKNSIHKLDLLLRTLEQMRMGMVAEWDLQQARIVKREQELVKDPRSGWNKWMFRHKLEETELELVDAKKEIKRLQRTERAARVGRR